MRFQDKTVPGKMNLSAGNASVCMLKKKKKKREKERDEQDDGKRKKKKKPGYPSEITYSEMTATADDVDRIFRIFKVRSNF